MSQSFKDEETLVENLKRMVTAETDGWSTAKLITFINKASHEANMKDRKHYEKVNKGMALDVLLTKLLARIAGSDKFYEVFARLSGVRLADIGLEPSAPELHHSDDELDQAGKRSREPESPEKSPRRGVDRKRAKLGTPFPLEGESSADEIQLVPKTDAKSAPPRLSEFLPPPPSADEKASERVLLYNINDDRDEVAALRVGGLPLLPRGLKLDHVARPVRPHLISNAIFTNSRVLHLQSVQAAWCCSARPSCSQTAARRTSARPSPSLTLSASRRQRA
jgi:hypothetical protein